MNTLEKLNTSSKSNHLSERPDKFYMYLLLVSVKRTEFGQAFF